MGIWATHVRATRAIRAMRVRVGGQTRIEREDVRQLESSNLCIEERCLEIFAGGGGSRRSSICAVCQIYLEAGLSE